MDNHKKADVYFYIRLIIKNKKKSDHEEYYKNF